MAPKRSASGSSSTDGGPMSSGRTVSTATATAAAEEKGDSSLAVSFCAMVLVGLGNRVFNKLETIPMRNYPNFLNLLTTFAYIPLSFLYIVPATRAGWIGPEQHAQPKRKFAVMGLLDCLAGIMQIFGVTYLPGALAVLVLQGAIPVSMAISRKILKAEYAREQYIGAVVVGGGIIVALLPQFSSMEGGGGTIILWSSVLIASCVPMCLSSVYKEIALGDVELDPVFLNGWIALFQFAFSLPLCVPAALTSDPPVYPGQLPDNLYSGFKCWFGRNSETCDSGDDSCYVDDCASAPLFVNTYICFNLGYNILIILILKYGSSNILWLAMTIMVPLSNVAFSLPFMPQSTPMHSTDIFGLLIIMVGLIAYRYGVSFRQYWFGEDPPAAKTDGGLTSSLIDDAERGYAADEADAI